VAADRSSVIPASFGHMACNTRIANKISATSTKEAPARLTCLNATRGASHIQPKTSVKECGLNHGRVFPHPIQIEVVAAKRIDVPAYQRSDVTQRLVIDLMPLGA
jgi:hypothetical protein